MISAWTKRFFLGCFLALPVACVVSVGEDDIDDDLPDGSGGSIAGSGGTSAGSSSVSAGA